MRRPWCGATGETTNEGVIHDRKIHNADAEQDPRRSQSEPKSVNPVIVLLHEVHDTFTFPMSERERHIRESRTKATHLHHSPSRRRIVDSAVLLLSLDASRYMGHVFLQVIAMMTASATMPQARPTSIPMCVENRINLELCHTARYQTASYS